MTCQDCARFDEDGRRCKDGKINPLTYAEALEASRYLGLRSLCVFNDFREQLLYNRRGAEAPRRQCSVSNASDKSTA